MQGDISPREDGSGIPDQLMAFRCFAGHCHTLAEWRLSPRTQVEIPPWEDESGIPDELMAKLPEPGAVVSERTFDPLQVRDICLRVCTA